MRDIGLEPPPVPGTEDSSLDALGALFGRAGLEDIATRAIDVSMTFPDFKDFWTSQTPSFTPATKMIMALSDTERGRLQDVVQEALPAGADGSIVCSARANAVKARVPA